MKTFKLTVLGTLDKSELQIKKKIRWLNEMWAHRLKDPPGKNLLRILYVHCSRKRFPFKNQTSLMPRLPSQETNKA